MDRLVRTLAVLVLLAPCAVGSAAAFSTVRDDNTTVDGTPRFSDPDAKINSDDGKEPQIRQFQDSSGSVTFGVQTQSATSPAFNRYGPSLFPGNDMSTTFGARR
jgi:hypothetical protein